MALTTRQRQFLKGEAHSLGPVVRVGKGSVTPSVVAETKNALHAHELIKVRVEVDDPAGRRALADRLATETESELVSTVGKIAILYRARDENPKIVLPAS